MATDAELGTLRTLHDRATREYAAAAAELERLSSEKEAYVQAAYLDKTMDAPTFQPGLNAREAAIAGAQATASQLQTKASMLASLIKMEGGGELAADVEAAPEPVEPDLLEQARRVLARG